jgi:hypothetical protein
MRGKTRAGWRGHGDGVDALTPPLWCSRDYYFVSTRLEMLIMVKQTIVVGFITNK